MPRANTNARRAYDKTRLAGIYKERRAAGLCVACGLKPGKPSKRSSTGIGCRCEECSARDSAKSAAFRGRKRPAWKALGICTICGTREAMRKRSYCGYCAEVQIEGQTLRRKSLGKRWTIHDELGNKVGSVVRVDFGAALVGAASVMGVRSLPAGYSVRSEK